LKVEALLVMSLLGKALIMERLGIIYR